MKRKFLPHLKAVGALLLAAALNPAANAQSQVGSDLLGTGLVMQEACALSSDGKTIVVGAPWHTGSASKKGLVRVYTLVSGVWTQRGSNIEGVATGDEWGSGVDISSDGLTFVAGAPLNDDNGNGSGHVRVFRWNGTAWVQRGLAIAGAAGGDLIGRAVAMSGDGNTIVFGSPDANVNFTDDGSTRVFRWNGTAWVQQGQTIAGLRLGDQAGWAVDISTDGKRIAIGAWSNDFIPSNSGHVRVFEWNSTTSLWVLLGSEIGGQKAGEQLGRSVGLSYSGDTLVAGAPMSSDSGLRRGMVRVYEYGSTLSWKQVGVNITGEANGDSCGHAVAISDNGRIIAIGSPRNDGVARDAGHVRIFKNLGAGWERAETVDIDGTASGPSNTTGQQFGRTVCMNRSGNNRLAAGSREASVNKGVVRVYTTAPVYCADGEVVWDGGGSTQLWTDRFNWVGDKCPCEGADVVFNGTNSTKEVRIFDTIVMSSIIATTAYKGRLRIEGDTARLVVGSLNLQGAKFDIIPTSAKAEVELGNLDLTFGSTMNLGPKGITVSGTTYVRGSQLNFQSATTANINNLHVDANGAFNSPQSNGIVNLSGYLRLNIGSALRTSGCTWNMTGASSHDLSFNSATVTTVTFNKLNISNAATFSNDNVVVTDTLRTIGSTSNVSGGLFQARARVIIGSSSNTMTSLTFNGPTGNQTLATATAGALAGTPVVVNKATSGNLVLNSDVNFGTLTLTKGHIDPNGNKATLTSNSISGASNASYIIGTAYIKKMDGAFSGNKIVVPVGNGGNLKPITIGKGGSTNDWKIDYVGSNPSSVDPDLHSSLSSISGVEYWTAQRLTADTFSTFIGLPATGSFDRVAWLTSGSWRSIGGSTSSGVITSTAGNLFKSTGTYSLTQGVFNTAPINVVTEKDMVSGTEVSLEKSNVSNQVAAANNSTALSVYPNPARTSIQVVLPSEAVSFHVSDMAGRVVGSYPASVRQLDLSNLKNGMYLITTEVNGTKQSIRIVKH